MDSGEVAFLEFASNSTDDKEITPSKAEALKNPVRTVLKFI
ncbi:hypothetical protein C2W58_02671 [Bacillus pumilus]|uniref:Uncharacterized protein n=1 Tax=Bacillus pumilus TaxID=1408 RepID=A0AB34QZN0_BACPU|nr:hypothetical protein B4127_4153 [Bacillus pumilus]RAP03915.1 hypothetical protein C2W58_02671 [Bacillus pumilus]